MIGIPSIKRTLLPVLTALGAILVGAAYWSGTTQPPSHNSFGVFAAFEPRAGQDAQLLAALRAGRTTLIASPGVVTSSVYQLVDGDKAQGVTTYLMITTFEKMSYVRSATRNQTLLAVNTRLSGLSDYSRIRIVNLKAGNIDDSDLEP